METQGGFVGGGLLSRNRSRYVVPRRPTTAMSTAPVHIAFASWMYRSNDDLAQRIRWVICVDEMRNGWAVRDMTLHETRARHPMPEIIASVLATVAGLDGPVWVVVSNRRAAVGARLNAAGVAVSVGLGYGNRAETAAVEIMREESERVTTDADVAGPAADDDDGVRYPDSEKHRSIEHHWWPTIRRVTPRESCDLIVATDCSVDPSGVAATAAISHRGDVAVDTITWDEPANRAEFDALILGLELIAAASPRGATLLSDSVDAVAVAHALHTREDPVGGYRGIGYAARRMFVDLLGAIRCPIQFRHVKGHCGHPLNEAADELANIARLATRYPRAVVEPELTERISYAMASAIEQSYDEHAHAAERPTPASAPGLSYSLADRLPPGFITAGPQS
ncbi:ribonuclease HI [Tsukamurella soli]